MKILCMFVLISLASTSTAHGQSSLLHIDTTLFRTINKHHLGAFHRVVVRHDDVVMPIGIALPIGLGISGYVREDHYLMDSGILSLASTALTYGVTRTVKHTVKRQRPFLRMYGVRASNIWSADRYSFPSGHTSMAFALATSLSLRYSGAGTIIPLYLWAGFVGYSRIYLGLHYPSDVLVGAIVGATVAVLVGQLDSFIERQRRGSGADHTRRVLPSGADIPLLVSLYGVGVGGVSSPGAFVFRLNYQL